MSVAGTLPDAATPASVSLRSDGETSSGRSIADLTSASLTSDSVATTQQSVPPALTLLPRSSVSSSTSSSPLASASSSSPTFKIMRRNQSNASISRNPSQSSSLALDPTTAASESGISRTSSGSPSNESAASLALRKARKDMTIEEREAAYKEARERIFQGFNGERGDDDSGASTSQGGLDGGRAFQGGTSAVPNTASDASSGATELSSQPDKTRSRERRREKPREKVQVWDRGGDSAMDPYAKGKGRSSDSHMPFDVGSGEAGGPYSDIDSWPTPGAQTTSPDAFPPFQSRSKDSAPTALRPLAPSFDPQQIRQAPIPEFYPRQQQQQSGWASAPTRSHGVQPTTYRPGQAVMYPTEGYPVDYQQAAAPYVADPRAYASAPRPPGSLPPHDRSRFGSATSSPTTARSPYATPPSGSSIGSGYASAPSSESGYLYDPIAVTDIPRHARTPNAGVNGSTRASRGLYDPTTGGIVPPVATNESYDQQAQAYQRRDQPPLSTFPVDLPPLRFGSGMLSNASLQAGGVGFFPADFSGAVTRKDSPQQGDSWSRPNVRKDTSFSSASSSTSSRSSRPSSQRSPSHSISSGIAGIPTASTLSHPLPARPDWALRYDHDSPSGSASHNILSGFVSGNTSRAASVASVGTSASAPASDLGSSAGGSAAGIPAGLPPHFLPGLGSGSASGTGSAREASPSASSSASASASAGLGSGHQSQDERGSFVGTASPVSTSTSGNVSIAGAGDGETDEEVVRLGLEGVSLGGKGVGIAPERVEVGGV